MKLLFCYDGPIAVDKNGNAYPQTFTEEVLNRYYCICDKFAMITRTRIIDPEKLKVKKANMEKFKIVSCPNITSLKGRIFNRNRAKQLIINEMEKSDYIIIRLPSQIGNLALDMAIKMNKPYLVEVVACRFDTLWHHSLLGKIISPYEFLKTRRRIKKAASVMYITEQFLQKRYPTNGKQFICPNVALNPLDVKVLRDKYIFIDKMKERNKYIITSIGAVNMLYKGHEYMIKALFLLISEGYNVEYHIIGGGSSEHLTKIANKLKISDKVFIHGALSRDEVFNFLDNTDIYVQPSLAEAQGRALIEAMSRACPCICTDVGGMPELLSENFIVRKKQPKELAEKVKLLIMNEKKLKDIALRNFEYVKKFDADAINKARIDMYKQVFDQQRIN